MNLLPSLEIALSAIKQNRMRSILTTLGIIIGVAAVIVMLSVGRGATIAIKKSFSRLGDNLLMIYPASISRGGVSYGIGARTSLKAGDAEAIKKECPSVGLVSPMVNSRAQAIYENQNWATRIEGVGSDYFQIRDWKPAAGNLFGEQEVKAATKVCLLGKVVAENLFVGTDPVGKIMRVNRIPFRIIGVLEEKGTGFGGDLDDRIIIPYTTAQRRLLGRTHLNNMQVTAITPELVSQAEKEVTDLLRERHKILADQEADFHIRNMADIIKTGLAVVGTIATLLGSVAGISLIVGGIGIMNIMLVSVTERTREIGIRMAVGAKRRDILLQFIIEAVLLSVLGGIIGISIGIGISVLVTVLAKWATSISTASILLAFSFSAAVGIFFGYWPARRAARLNPIDALRYE